MPSQFQIESQTESEWCWAAVAVSIEKYFNPRSTLTQCQVARRVIAEDCCNGPAECNDAETLIQALQGLNRWKRTLDGAATFQQVKQELDARRPVCARIAWPDGYHHFVILVGYEVLQSGARHLQVADPWNPSSTVDFDEFKSAYCGDGTWVDTYFVTESSKHR